MAKSAPLKKEATVITEGTTTAARVKSGQPAFVFGKINYLLMLVGIVVIISGYLLMIGGHPENPAEFNSKELYSATRITIAPIVIVIGLLIEAAAIMIKAKD